MHYWQSYRFVFKNPNWLVNLLLGSVCLLIPVIGQIVLIGYLFEVIDVLLRRSATPRRSEDHALNEQVMDALPADSEGQFASYPDFEFGRFTAYLTRGVWPWLVRFIINMVVAMLIGFVAVVGFIIAGAAAAGADSPWPIFVMYGVFWLIYAFAMLIASILSTPIYLRAGLSGDFSAAFSMEFYRDFMKRVGMEVVLAQLFLAATGTFVTLGGLLLCYVGVFPAAILLTYASHHLEYQLYALYLERGGTPVPRKDTQAEQPERYAEEEWQSEHVMRPQPEDRSTDATREDKDW